MFGSMATGQKDKCTVLVISPSTRGGSWLSTEHILKGIANYYNKKRCIIIACTGMPGHKITVKNTRHIYIKNVSYFKYENILMKAPLFSILYLVPIILLSIILQFIYKPIIIVANGIVLSLSTIPYKLFSRKKAVVVLSYHGAIEKYINPSLRKILRLILNSIIDIAIVNSAGSKKDLALIFDEKRILILEHIVDKIFFIEERISRDELREKMGFKKEVFIITFVGHLNYEKLFDIFYRVVKYFCKSNEYVFLIVGSGPLEKLALRLSSECKNVKYFGYISNKELLKKIYYISDIVWSYGDTTYIARPAAESLAVGTPVIIPDTPAVLKKRLMGIKIPRNLIPDDVGWIVDHKDLDNIVKIIMNLKRNKEKLLKNRQICKEYASMHHSSKNIEHIIKIIDKLIKNKNGEIYER